MTKTAIVQRRRSRFCQQISRLGAALAVSASWGELGCGGAAHSDDAAESMGSSVGGAMSAESKVDRVPAKPMNTTPPMGCDTGIVPALRDSTQFPSDIVCFDNFNFECYVPSIEGIESTRKAATDRLSYYCGDCHGPQSIGGGEVGATFDYVDDFDRLLSAGLLARCSSITSPLIQSITNGTMPPSNHRGPRIDANELALLSLAIDDECRLVDCVCTENQGSPGCPAARQQPAR